MNLPKKQNSTFSFVKTKRFGALFMTQFTGALNDSLFKTALFVMITFYGLGHSNWLPQSQMLNLGSFLFILPFFIFSALSGQLSNKYDKAWLARMVKIFEIIIMIIAALGFYLGSIWLLMSCLFFMGVHSTIFGPLKYAIIPDYLEKRELLAGNSLIESGTFVAILAGQILGTAIAGHSIFLVTVVVITIAVLGLSGSIMMPSVMPKKPDTTIDVNVFRGTWALLKETRKQKQLYVAIVGISWFWCISSVYTTQLPIFTQIQLGGNENVFNLMIILFSIGIGLGSIICAKISREQIHLGLVIIGTIGLGICGLLLVTMTSVPHHNEALIGLFTFIQQPKSWLIMLMVSLLGFFGGFFSLPLYTWLQTASAEIFRAHAIAANNIVNGLFMVAAAIVSAIVLFIFDSVNFLYLTVSLGNFIILIYFWYHSPAMFNDFKVMLQRKSK